nr:pilin [Pelomonas sp. BJYL3]
MVRSQVSEPVALLTGLKAPLSEYGADKNAWPTTLVAPTVTPSAGELNATLIGKYSTVTNKVGGTYPAGTLTATMTTGKASGQVLTLTTGNGGSTWSCGNTTVDGVVGAGTTIEAKYLPNACKP